jgi:hypothetical protein
MAVTNPIQSFRRAARNSPWLVMSILAHAILLVWLGLLVIRHETGREPKEIRGIAITGVRSEPPPIIPLPEPIVRAPIPHDVPIELVNPDDYIPDLTAIAPPDVDLTKQIGTPDSVDPIDSQLPPASSAIGLDGPGGRGSGVSPAGGFRPEWDPKKPFGGGQDGRPPLARPVEIDKAIREGFLWLCRHQNRDGSWGALSMRERCEPDHPCFDPKLQANDHYDEGLTGLALLAFLGAGISHKSQAILADSFRGQRYDLGKVVENGLKWLRSRQNPDGSFTRDRAFLYNEALATMAMCEAYGMTQAPYWRTPAEKGVAFLQRAQRLNPSGEGRWGWRYASREDVVDFRKGTGDEAAQREAYDSDTSVTAWCVMALKSAEL